jgi:hypothetical protein
MDYEHAPGEHRVAWRPENLPMEVNFYWLRARQATETKRLLLLK